MRVILACVVRLAAGMVGQHVGVNLSLFDLSPLYRTAQTFINRGSYNRPTVQNTKHYHPTPTANMSVK